jgi:ribosome-associated protein
MKTETLLNLVIESIGDIKGHGIRTLDVRKVSSVTDYMVVATGNTNRQVGAIARHVMEESKKHGHPPLGSEGENTGEWILVDLGDVVVHIMQPHIRDFYQLEKLWGEMEELPATGSF